MSNTSLYIDSLLLSALKENDEKALNHLFITYYNKLYRVGLKSTRNSALTEECIQLVFKDLWQYRQSLGEVRSFEAYLVGSLQKRLSRELKRFSIDESVSFEENPFLFLSVESYEEVLLLQEQNEENKIRIQKALNELTPRQKEVIILKYFEELSFKEISEKTQIQIDSVYKLLHEAIKKLRILLHPEGI